MRRSATPRTDRFPRVDRYLLDANALVEDLWCVRTPARLLMREARLGRVGLLVPEIVFEEVVNHYREQVEEQVAAWRRSIRRLRRLRTTIADVREPADPTVAADAYRAGLRAILLGSGATFLPFPSVSHETVVARALGRRPPFDADGENGYRDALVWETVLAAADPDDPIVLVSADKNAFGADRQRLRDELAAELRERGLPWSAVRRISRIEDFTSQLPSNRAAEEKIEALLAAATGEAYDLLVAVIEEEALDWEVDRTSLIGLPFDVVRHWTETFDRVTRIEVVAAREVDGGLAVDLEVQLQATLEVHTADPAAYDRGIEGFQVTGYDHEEGLVTGRARQAVEGAVFSSWDREGAVLEWAEVENFIPLGPPDPIEPATG